MIFLKLFSESDKKIIILFEPLEVAVTTGMEDEQEVFSHRAKLFRFARECTPPEWKERGLGDIKIMENNNTKVKIPLLL